MKKEIKPPKHVSLTKILQPMGKEARQDKPLFVVHYSKYTTKIQN